MRWSNREVDQQGTETKKLPIIKSEMSCKAKNPLSKDPCAQMRLLATKEAFKNIKTKLCIWYRIHSIELIENISNSLKKRFHFIWLPVCNGSWQASWGRTSKRCPSPTLPDAHNQVCRKIAQVLRRPEKPKLGLFDGGGWLRYHFFSNPQACAENIPVADTSGKSCPFQTFNNEG